MIVQILLLVHCYMFNLSEVFTVFSSILMMELLFQKKMTERSHYFSDPMGSDHLRKFRLSPLHDTPIFVTQPKSAGCSQSQFCGHCLFCLIRENPNSAQRHQNPQDSHKWSNKNEKSSLESSSAYLDLLLIMLCFLLFAPSQNDISESTRGKFSVQNILQLKKVIIIPESDLE